MNQNKQGSSASQLTCDICKINFVSHAEYALHEFSKKHCDNLIRLAKHKPIITKQKPKAEVQPVEKETPKVNIVTHTGSFAKYGYFVPGEIYQTAETPKEFNTEYDPYLQKFSGNSCKEESAHLSGSESQIVPGTLILTENNNKKKKKKIKICQICNITMKTLPQYEAHMRGPQHIWKLKMSGMGVSAHFVKASTDLHTTDINEDFKSNDQPEEPQETSSVSLTPAPENLSGPFPLLYCSDCELLLNSPQQYNAHITGKAHLECAQRKAELKAKKEKSQKLVPNKLYCYSCKISLNNIVQYNEHKNGKKHKIRCKELIRRGFTIPPEERVPELPIQKAGPNEPIVYPELYEKFVLEKQKVSEYEVSSYVQQYNDICNAPPTNTFLDTSKMSCLSPTKEHDKTASSLSDRQEVSNPSFKLINLETSTNSNVPKVDDITSNSSLTNVDMESPPRLTTGIKFSEEEESESGEHFASQITVVTDSVKCSVCELNFNWQCQFDEHLNTEDHYKKILELKLKGKFEGEILSMIFCDRNCIKPDGSGRFCCSICSVTTVNRIEFDQHLNSIVHKYTHKDYKMKRTIEMKNIIGCNELGLYFCKLCKEGWASIVDFVQHLHCLKHKSTQRAERAKKVLAKRKTKCLQKQRSIQGLKRSKMPVRRLKIGKNPGVRTKICGVATDLLTGAQAAIPNLEPLEPKIDPIKNINIGMSEKSDEAMPQVSHIKRRRSLSSNKKQKSFGSQPSPAVRPEEIPPLIPPTSRIPPLMPLPLLQQQAPCPRPNYFNRNLCPLSSPYPPPFSRFCEQAPTRGPGFRKPGFKRPRWPRY